MGMVERSSWRNLLCPHASRLAGVNTSLGSNSRCSYIPNRIDSSVSIGRIEKEIRKFENDDCTSADDQLEKALERMQVLPEDAEMTFVRHYQGRHNVRFSIRPLMMLNGL